MRQKKKSAGPIAGIIIIIIGIIVLWSNEGNNVRNLKTVEEARNVLVNVSADKVDPANEGKLVSTNGKMVVEDESLLDSTFNVESPKTARLTRVVEMYQWVEVEEDDGDYVTYRYKKEWLPEIEDSDTFNDSSKVNPSSMPYDAEDFYADNVTLGAFTISDAQKALLDTGATVTLNETVSVPGGYYRVGNYIASVSDLNAADVGDVRISFKYNNDKEISILAKQSGSSFAPYTSEQGKTLFRVEKGIMTGEEIINVVETENNILKWVLRLLGVLLNMAGFAALLSPIVFLTKWIPLLGNGIAKFIKAIGALVGLAVSLVIISISWIFYRPLVGILLLAGVVGVVVLIAMLVKKSKAVPGEQQPVAQAPVVQQPVAGVQPAQVVVPVQPAVQAAPVQQPVQPAPMAQPVQQPVAPVQPQVVQQPVQQAVPAQPQVAPVQPQVVQQPVVQPQPVQPDPNSTVNQNNIQQ